MAIYIWLLYMDIIHIEQFAVQCSAVQCSSLREVNKQVEKSIDHNDRLISSKEDIEACKRSSSGQRTSESHGGCRIKLGGVNLGYKIFQDFGKVGNGTGVGEGRK